MVKDLVSMHVLVFSSMSFLSHLPNGTLLISLLSSGTCTNRDISISQSRDSSSGIPQYIVQIVNTCVSGCAPSDIHLHCGWFASARIVNPRIFKRLFYDDCLVNGGKPLESSQIIRFTYSNSFMYPLAFKSAKFCWINSKQNKITRKNCTHHNHRDPSEPKSQTPRRGTSMVSAFSTA